MRRIIAALTAVTATLGIVATCAASSSATPAATATHCGGYGHLTGLTNGRQSLHYWALKHGSDISNVISSTLWCEDGRIEEGRIASCASCAAFLAL